LPDDRVVNRPAGLNVPHHGGLALIGDAQRCDIGGGQLGFGERLAEHGTHVAPDLQRIVLDPARAGQDLRGLAGGRGHHGAGGVEDDRPRRGGALIDGHHLGARLSGHAPAPSRIVRCPRRRPARGAAALILARCGAAAPPKRRSPARGGRAWLTWTSRSRRGGTEVVTWRRNPGRTGSVRSIGSGPGSDWPRSSSTWWSSAAESSGRWRRSMRAP